MEKPAAAQSEAEFKDPGSDSDDFVRRRPAKFTFFGEAIIEKKVRPMKKSGRIYLPPDWVGKRVKIIRMD